MRRGEILALRWADVDEPRETAYVRRTLQPTTTGLVFSEPKTRRSRRAVALPRFLESFFERQARSQERRRKLAAARWRDLDLIVDGCLGEPVNPDTFSSAWRRLVKEHGFPHVRFHDLRHAHATLMLPRVCTPRSSPSASGTRASASRSIPTPTSFLLCRLKLRRPPTSCSHPRPRAPEPHVRKQEGHLP